MLANKNDFESLGVDELIEKLNLKALVDREVLLLDLGENSVNIDITIDWLIKHCDPREAAGLRRQIYSANILTKRRWKELRKTKPRISYW